MMKILLVICILYILDALFTRTYCKIQKNKDAVYGANSWDKPQYTTAEVRSYKFPKKQVKYVFHLYKGWIRYKLHMLGNFPSHTYRNFILRNVYLMKIARTAVIYGGFEIRAPWKIEIGEGTIIGDECKLDGRNGLIIGKNCNFSTGVWIWTEQHDMNDPYFASNRKGGSVVIGDRAWISSRSIILPGINIEEGCVLAAGAVATKNLTPSFSVWGGYLRKKLEKGIMT